MSVGGSYGDAGGGYERVVMVNVWFSGDGDSGIVRRVSGGYGGGGDGRWI